MGGAREIKGAYHMANTEPIAYLNGEFVPMKDAKVSIEDRGFLFSDGIYEVVRVYDGKTFMFREHFERLRQGLRYLEIPFNESPEQLQSVVDKLIEINGISEATVYMQVTRGYSPRDHVFPDRPVPTVIMFVRKVKRISEMMYETGCSAITVPDNRWGLCYVKATGLLPNVIAKEKARRASCYEAIFVRNGLVTEGASSSVFAAFGQTLYTHPLANILPGVTRKLVLEIAESAGLNVKEEALPLDEFMKATEVVITSTGVEVLPVTSVDGKPIGTGVPGGVFKTLRSHYRNLVISTLNRLC
jgi:D-alanine transaminase